MAAIVAGYKKHVIIPYTDSMYRLMGVPITEAGCPCISVHNASPVTPAKTNARPCADQRTTLPSAAQCTKDYYMLL